MHTHRFAARALLFPLLFAACAQKEPVPTEIGGTVNRMDLQVPEFIQLTKDDLFQMKRAMGRAREKVLRLSEEQEAQCNPESCFYKGKKAEGRLMVDDIQKFVSMIEKAAKTKKEERFTDGPITLRCIPELCFADLKMVDNILHPSERAENAAGTRDYSGVVLNSFIPGLMSRSANR